MIRNYKDGRKLEFESHKEHEARLGAVADKVMNVLKQQEPSLTVAEIISVLDLLKIKLLNTQF